VRRIRDAQEEERRRKLEELKQHAQQAQKFREQQEEMRRRHIDELRSKDMDRRAQVEERRRDIEKSEQERREAILARNKERESRLETQRRSSRGNIEFAFGSSAPRLVEPRVDSASGYWGSRSGQGYDKQSQEREPTDLRSKRTASAQGLDRSNEGWEVWRTEGVGGCTTPERRRGARAKSQGAKNSTRSQPSSPCRETHPLHWFVRDIDIGEKSSDTRSDCTGSRRRSTGTSQPHYMLPLMRTRSRHDCSFVPGTPFLAGDENGLTSVGTPNTAHRRRTDLVPTLTMRREDNPSGSATPRRSPGRAVSMSRLEQLARPQRQLLRPQHVGGAVQGARSMQHLAPPSPGQTGGLRGRELTNGGGRARARTLGATPKEKKGLSRENSSSSRPGSALSAHRNTVGGVRLRPGSAGGRRQRPLSIATTGMTASMYEERQKPTPTSTPSHTRGKGAGTPKPDRLKRARSVTSDTGGLDDDNRSTASSQSVGPSRTPNRRTPSQVKAEAAARKAKTLQVGGSLRAPPLRKSRSAINLKSTRMSKISETPLPAAAKSQTSTPKSSLGGRKEAAEKKEETKSRKTPSPAVSQDLGEAAGGDANGRQSTPDILRDNNTKRPQTELEQEKAEEAPKEEEKDADEKQEDLVKEASPLPVPKEATPEVVVASKEGSQEAEELPNNEEVREKKIITSEEEAKARIAEKRREMKEQKEREAEAERLRLEEERRLEEEQRRKEEEEMKQMERLAEEGRRAEEERIQKAIQEREEEERKAKEEEERLKKEKEETEKKTKEEAEKREAELQEKLKKEEEERLARKKRIEEIMARTRGKTAAPAPKEEPAPSSPSPPQQPASLDPLGDPTKPDLLGDISDKVEAENAKNLAAPAPAEPEVEKGALDSLSLKSEDTENSSPLITMENGNSMPIKKSNGVVEGGSFDQILDLGDLGDSNKEERSQGMPSPMRAFEENSQQGGGGALEVADLLS